MFRVAVDTREFLELTREALFTLGRAPSGMLEILRDKAAEERAADPYTNRTGNLRASTFAAWVEQGPSEYSVEYGARTFYASFVNARGYMVIDEIIPEAQAAVDAYLERESAALSRI